MPGDFEIKKFITANRAEVKDMCLTEYDEAETMEMFREEGREEGRSFDNVILEELTKEYMVEKKLFPYIPFYIARYEKDIRSGNNLETVTGKLAYFRDEIIRLHDDGALSDSEMIDIMGFVNTIITHITNGNEYEERRNVFGAIWQASCINCGYLCAFCMCHFLITIAGNPHP